MWSDLAKYLWTQGKVLIISLLVATATASDVMAFAPLPGFLITFVRITGLAAAVIVVICLIYGFGKFRQSNQTTEAALAIKQCCRYIRFEPHSIDFDVGLLNRLTRGLWLRKHHPQWTVARLDADSQYLFLAGGSHADIVEGLVFSILRVGNGIPCRYQVGAADITAEETRLRPIGFQIRAADEPAFFLIDLVDPSADEVGRQFDLERFLSGVLGALGVN